VQQSRLDHIKPDCLRETVFLFPAQRPIEKLFKATIFLAALGFPPPTSTPAEKCSKAGFDHIKPDCLRETGFATRAVKLQSATLIEEARCHGLRHPGFATKAI